MNTTTATTETAATALDRLHAEFKTRTAPVSKKEAEAIVKAWKDAKGKRQAAEDAFEAAKKLEAEAAAAIVRARGKGRVMIDGEVYTPMARKGSESIFLRPEGTKDVKTFG